MRREQHLKREARLVSTGCESQNEITDRAKKPAAVRGARVPTREAKEFFDVRLAGLRSNPMRRRANCEHLNSHCCHARQHGVCNWRNAILNSEGTLLVFDVAQNLLFPRASNTKTQKSVPEPFAADAFCQAGGFRKASRVER